MEISILDEVAVGLTTAIEKLTVNGNATVGGGLKSVGDVIVEATRSNVLSNVTNKQQNGFAQLYFRNISGTSQEGAAGTHDV